MKDRTLLGIDTSTRTLSLAVVRLPAAGGHRVLASRDVPPGPNHSKLLPLAIEEILGEAGEELRALDGICVGLGPGAFTGLRIALATAKGLSWAARIPLAGASTLEAMALRAADLAPEAAAIVPLLDARKREVYAGFFRPSQGGVDPLGDGPAELVAPPQVVAERLAALQGPVLVLGEGYLAYRSIFDEALVGRAHEAAEGLPQTPPAAEIARLAADRLAPWSREAVFSLEPSYIRQSDAELFGTRPKKRV